MGTEFLLTLGLHVNGGFQKKGAPFRESRKQGSRSYYIRVCFGGPSFMETPIYTICTLGPDAYKWGLLNASP